MPSLQLLIVALLVPGCVVYAAWRLMPSAGRRALAAHLLRLPRLPRRLESTLRRAAAQAASGCGCDGCDHAEPMPAQQPITFHPRKRG
jgi:hypothetical protein